jgi:hypothetical protein
MREAPSAAGEALGRAEQIVAGPPPAAHPPSAAEALPPIPEPVPEPIPEPVPEIATPTAIPEPAAAAPASSEPEPAEALPPIPEPVTTPTAIPEPAPTGKSERPTDRLQRAASEAPFGRFGLDRIVLLLREPTVAFAYWEIDPARIAGARAAGSGRAELRLVDVADGRSVQALEVAPEQGRSYFSDFPPGRGYRAELLWIGAESGEVVLSRSRAVGVDSIPPATISRP